MVNKYGKLQMLHINKKWRCLWGILSTDAKYSRINVLSAERELVEKRMLKENRDENG